MEVLKAFHNQEEIKEKYLQRVEDHYRADEIIQGVYWENDKGCAVGCTIEGSDHGRYETELGIPRMIARLEDRIFEGLRNGEAKEFPLRFLKAIKVGADLSQVPWKFLIWLLEDPKSGVLQYAKPDGKKAIQDIVKALKNKLKGKNLSSSEWLILRKAARAYAAAAADAAAYAAAAYAAAAYAADAAYAAADAAYATAATTAYAAAYAAATAAAAADAADAADAAADAAYAAYAAAADAADATRRKHYTIMAEKLLSLLGEAK